ncbi:MAG: hypothetical protein OXJ52_04560 [Oligoflexia bacterium]|nr:hypothetical protein [Oligoflexia bacterium]
MLEKILLFAFFSSTSLAVDTHSLEEKRHIATFKLIKYLLEEGDIEIYSMVRNDKKTELNKIVKYVSKDGDNILHFIAGLGVLRDIPSMRTEIIALHRALDKELFFKLLNRKNKKGLSPKDEIYKNHGRGPMITSLFAFIHLGSGIGKINNGLKKAVSGCKPFFKKFSSQ